MTETDEILSELLAEKRIQVRRPDIRMADGREAKHSAGVELRIPVGNSAILIDLNLREVAAWGEALTRFAAENTERD